MNIKSVVKVMNFHALLRVDKSRKQAERYNSMAHELEAMMRIILNNRNLRLDKTIRMPDPTLPVLRIYIGSDYGFCGSVNSFVGSAMAADGESTERIVIGKKVRKSGEISLYLDKDVVEDEFSKVREYLAQAVHKREWSAVELVYSQYVNMATIKPVVQRIYPLKPEEEEGMAASEMTKAELLDDFVIEGYADTLLEEMIISYLCHAVKIALVSSMASENVMRQNTTQESLKKLDEIAEHEFREERKRRTQEAINKSIDSFAKQKALAR